MKRQIFGFLTILLLSLILVACQETETDQEGSSEGNDQTTVVTSFYPIYEFTKQVAGDQADVTLMVSAGEDAHHYEPSAQDVARVNEADVFVYSSELMEHWVESLLSTIENDHLLVARTADGLEADYHEHDHGDEDHKNDSHDHEQHDPHIWLDPVLAQDQVKIILDALIEADPAGKEIYQANAEAFNQELQSLHKEFEAAFSDAENRVFVVQHEAFGYLADRYDIEQVAIGGISTEVEPSPSRIAEIGDLVEKYNLPVIYYQHGANSVIAETVANETGTETAILYDLEVLSKELEDKDIGYVGAMRENLKNLQISIH